MVGTSISCLSPRDTCVREDPLCEGPKVEGFAFAVDAVGLRVLTRAVVLPLRGARLCMCVRARLRPFRRPTLVTCLPAPAGATPEASLHPFLQTMNEIQDTGRMDRIEVYSTRIESIANFAVISTLVFAAAL